MAQNIWWTIGAAVLRHVTRAIGEVDFAARLAPKPVPEYIFDDPQRDRQLTHTFPQTVPSGVTPPLVVFAEPSDALVQLLNFAIFVTPEVALTLCCLGMLCIILGMTLCLCTCVRCVSCRSFRLCPCRRRSPHPTPSQLSDMALHYYSLVQSQNPGLLNMTSSEDRRR